MQKVLFFPLVFLLISFVPANVAAEPLTIITWNVEGPGGLADKDLSALGDFIENADVVVIEEVLGADQLEATMIGASVETWNSAVSNFAKDSFSDPFKKQELGVITQPQGRARLAVGGNPLTQASRRRGSSKIQPRHEGKTGRAELL